ncbi:MAG: hypothetical protein A2622_02970 [Bdellovibrionales bacterium RIFCSPHIGHO2_01_FULL_40_29]|nr:MAG: hypothetical protein A2622_02970 [Bdellovibrionales bacterium RIFCSPHIGHO2_01_FULL_40_29]OFZ34037.1 MAG: hypothetical protein A3D17_03390 [Bdellovibrionales bacterium RIFCSPHIGHO2_02_FULL_40_15]
MSRFFASCFLFLLFTNAAYSSSFDLCLEHAAKQEHKLDRQDGVQNCFIKNKAQLNSEKCYRSIKKVNLTEISQKINEQIKSVCFYEVSRFRTIKSCLEKSQLFETAINKDEAVFDCFAQFQNVLNQRQCLNVSQYLIYPAKKEHLKTHCLNSF